MTISQCIFLDENEHVLVYILLKFIPEGPIDNKLPLVQLMAWFHDLKQYIQASDIYVISASVTELQAIFN